MNTHAEYRRHRHSGTPATPAAPSMPEVAFNKFDLDRDPSLPVARLGPPVRTKGIAWVRPTDLTSYSAPLVGRGIDLHAELIRRARRAPTLANRSIHRHLAHPPSPTPSPTSTPTRLSTCQEGLEL